MVKSGYATSPKAGFKTLKFMKIFLKTLLFLIVGGFVFAIIVLNVSAQTLNEEAISVESLKLKTGQLLNSEVISADTVAYSFKGDVVDNASNIIFYDNANYSNTEKVSDNTLKIYSSYTFFRDENNFVKNVEFATTTKKIWDSANVQTLQDKILGLISIPYAIASPYFTLTDGILQKESAVSFSTSRNATTAGGGTNTLLYPHVDNQSSYHSCYRAYLNFDASALPDDAIVSSSTVYLFDATTEMGSIENDDNSSNQLTPFYPANPASITTNDFNKFTDTVLSTKTLASANINAYNVFSLSNLGYISATGTTSFYLRNSIDVANGTPIGNNWELFDSSTYTGTSRDPFLLIEYTTPAPTPPTTGTTTPLNCIWPVNSDISIITACKIIYGATTSTTTLATTSVEMDYYYSPAILYFYIFSLFGACSIIYFIFKK